MLFFIEINFIQIDFSSRPIDPIFRQAREQLEHEKGSVSGDAATSCIINAENNISTNNSTGFGSNAITSCSNNLSGDRKFLFFFIAIR